MSIRTLMQPHNKNWLQIKANTVETFNLDINYGETINIEAEGIIDIDGDVGAVDNVIRKNITNDLSWDMEKEFGQQFQTFSALEASTTSTTSTSYISVPGTRWTTTNLEAGTYLLQTCIESTNNLETSRVQIVQDPTGTPIILASHEQIGEIPDWCANCNFFPLVLSGINTFEYQFAIRIAGITSVRRVRFFLYRII